MGIRVACGVAALLAAGASCSGCVGNSQPGSDASVGTGAGGGGGSTAGTGGASAQGGAAGGGSGGATGAGGGRGGTGGTAGGGAGGAAGGRGGAGGTSGTVPTFETRVLATDQVAEGAEVGDINGDGVLDLVAGPRWYAGPAFTLGGTLYANPPTFPMDQYSTHFLTFVDDIDGDGRPDVIAIGDAGIAVAGAGAGVNARWYRNPGPAGLAQPWPMYPLYGSFVSNESPAYVNLVGDAKKELVFMANRQLGYAQPGADPTQPWTFHAISTAIFNTPYVHGLGVGDVDGDGLPDVLERTGWWRQVAGAAPTWEQHTVDFGAGADKSASNWGGSQMYAYDVDGDGDADVVTALAAHRYGLSWFEQQRSGTTSTFVPHQILPATAGNGNVSQLHATAVADLDGDGLLDIITGKRYYAHPSTNPDPGTTEPPVIAWFQLQRGAAGVTFMQRVIHDASGVGCNFAVRDLNGDGKPDIFVTNKKGTFLHQQRP